MALGADPSASTRYKATEIKGGGGWTPLGVTTNDSQPLIREGPPDVVAIDDRGRRADAPRSRKAFWLDRRLRPHDS